MAKKMFGFMKQCQVAIDFQKHLPASARRAMSGCRAEAVRCESASRRMRSLGWVRGGTVVRAVHNCTMLYLLVHGMMACIISSYRHTTTSVRCDLTPDGSKYEVLLVRNGFESKQVTF